MYLPWLHMMRGSQKKWRHVLTSSRLQNNITRSQDIDVSVVDDVRGPPPGLQSDPEVSYTPTSKADFPILQGARGHSYSVTVISHWVPSSVQTEGRRGSEVFYPDIDPPQKGRGCLPGRPQTSCFVQFLLPVFTFTFQLSYYLIPCAFVFPTCTLFQNDLLCHVRNTVILLVGTGLCLCALFSPHHTHTTHAVQVWPSRPISLALSVLRYFM